MKDRSQGNIMLLFTAKPTNIETPRKQCLLQSFKKIHSFSITSQMCQRFAHQRKHIKAPVSAKVIHRAKNHTINTMK